MSPFFPDCFDEWSLIKYHDDKSFDTVFEGTEQQCRDYAYENFSDAEIQRMFLMDWEAREWEV